MLQRLKSLFLHCITRLIVLLLFSFCVNNFLRSCCSFVVALIAHSIASKRVYVCMYAEMHVFSSGILSSAFADAAAPLPPPLWNCRIPGCNAVLEEAGRIISHCCGVLLPVSAIQLKLYIYIHTHARLYVCA